MVKMWNERKLLGNVIDITPSETLSIGEIDFTNSDDLVGRGCEIRQWLQVNGSPKDQYVIFDDSDDILQSQRPFFVHVDPCVGITKSDVQKAIEILMTWERTRDRAWLIILGLRFCVISLFFSVSFVSFSLISYICVSGLSIGFIYLLIEIISLIRPLYFLIFVA